MNEPSRNHMGSDAMSGRATVSLLWVIFGILVMLAMGFLAWNSYQQIEGLEKGAKDAKGKEIEGLEAVQAKNEAQRVANRYLTATEHHAAGILDAVSVSGGVRSLSVYDLSAFLRGLEGVAIDSGLYADSSKVKELVDELRRARETMVGNYEAAIRRMGPRTEEDDDPLSVDRAPEAFPGREALQTFNLDNGKLKTIFEGEASVPTSYITGLMRAFQLQYEARKQEHDNLYTELFGADSGLMDKEREATNTFEQSVATIRARTRDLINSDGDTKIDESLTTIREASDSIESTRQSADARTSEVFAKMAGNGGWVSSFQMLREKKALLARYRQREAAVGKALSAIVEASFGTDLQADGRVLRVSPNASDVYIDLDATDHIDVGLVFEVYGLSRAALARGDVNGPRTLRGEVEVIEVGGKGRPSRARITLARGPMQPGDILVNREFNPGYKPRVALAGIFKGYRTRETLAEKLSEFNYEVQEEAGYDTDFIIRGDGGLPEEPMIDGLPASELGIKSVPMRRVLRMLQLPLSN
ncbi:MAG: hypothetical protein H6834_12265 [Planctomycetes bacterium]|nr:hypothetical protein [Planctomycetota bacterium]